MVFQKGHKINLGKKSNHWKGGKKKNYAGYILIYQPKHPFCTKSGYIKHSRLVMEQILGRYLTPEEQVHHKGIKYSIGSIKNKQDDRPENLQLFANDSEHKKFHYPKGSKFGINS